MPDHLGSDMRKTKTEDKEDKPIQCKNELFLIVLIVYYENFNPSVADSLF